MKRICFGLCLFVLLGNQCLLAGLNDGLVAYYPFNGNANDVTSNANNGVVYGATLTSDRFGNPNSAYHFNGTSDYIMVEDSPSLRPQEVTVAAWANPEITYNLPWLQILTKRINLQSFPYNSYLLAAGLPNGPENWSFRAYP